MSIEEQILSLEKEMVPFLQSMIRVPSVKSLAGRQGAPFGEELAKALDTVLAWGVSQGFRCKNIDGYAGHIEYGSCDETVGVLVHLDVVPAGDGWSLPPFEGQIQDHKIYGRGTIDDKGPAVASMFALKAIKDEGIPLKRKIRIIFGCDEESSWECMKAYFNAEPKPNLGFTPDGDFPLIFCEKGNLVMTFEIDRKGDSSCKGIRLENLQGGTRRNIVPEKAEAVLSFSELEKDFVLEFLNQACSKDIFLSYEALSDRSVRVSAKGKAAHGSTPELGDNAVVRLIMVLNELNGQGKAWDIIRFLVKKIGRDTSGLNFGIRCSDKVSGELTLNLGVLTIDNDKGEAQIDIRYPISAEGEKMAQTIQSAAQAAGVGVSYQHIIPSHYVDPNSPLIKLLLKTYRAETGDDSPPLAIGGRTYATTMGNAVAFGPLFPGQPEMAHQRDEYIAIDDLMKCCRLYAKALIALAGGA